MTQDQGCDRRFDICKSVEGERSPVDRPNGKENRRRTSQAVHPSTVLSLPGGTSTVGNRGACAQRVGNGPVIKGALVGPIDALPLVRRLDPARDTRKAGGFATRLSAVFALVKGMFCARERS